MPSRKPPRSISTDVHCMGDHVLFHHARTSKRFPFLSSVPQSELANLFHVAPVDREAEKMEELRYSEPYVDPNVVFRERAVGKKPFVPTNPRKAKDSIVGTVDSVHVGTYYDHWLAEQESSAKAKGAIICTMPFSRGGSALAASEAIQNRCYLNAVDTEIAAQVREMTRHRIKVNRELLAEREAELRRRLDGRGESRQHRAITVGPTASGKAPSSAGANSQRKDNLRSYASDTDGAPRPMTGNLQLPSVGNARLGK